jgi:AraC-like DNA-binding protein
VKTAYTYDFPAGTERSETGDVFRGLSFILYVCRWATRIAAWNHPGVVSPYWRLLHCTRGCGHVMFGSSRITLTPQNLILIPADVETDFEATEEIDMLYVHFLPLLPVDLGLVAAFSAPCVLQATAAHQGLIATLTGPAREPEADKTDSLVFRALLDVCFAELLKPYAGSQRLRALPDPRVIGMLAHMREHYAMALTNRRLAHTSGLGKDQAMRLCRKVTGRTLQEHLRGIRLAEATRLIVGSDTSIKQIASACGFANRFHFSRVFAKRFGLGPAAFRQRIARSPDF